MSALGLQCAGLLPGYFRGASKEEQGVDKMVFNIGNSRVIESREVSDGAAIRRRRETPDGKRFTTYERVEKPNLAVIKKNGDRELFDRVKLANSTRRSVFQLAHT